MLTVKYDKYGESISDYYVVDKVKDAIYKVTKLNSDEELHISNETIVDLVLSAIKLKLISSSQVKLFNNDLEIRLGKDGELLDEMPFTILEIVFNGLFAFENIFA